MPTEEHSAARGAHPYQDASLPVEQRVDDLLSRMPLEDKVGLLFHTVAGTGDIGEPHPRAKTPAVSTLLDSGLTHFNIVGSSPSAREFAQWTNAVQRLALSRPLGVPVTVASDPRHHFSDNPLLQTADPSFSQWPEVLGLAALGSTERIAEFADTVRREYLAVGVRVALHPQVDLATEPRWSRVNGTFGEDADLTCRLVTQYIDSLQHGQLGPASVATMTKHFPGGGAQKDGYDPHFSWGREQIYPGDNLAYHLRPFQAAIAAGTRQIMPSYGVPVGTGFEEVAFGFNKSVLTGLLRERLEFDGVICTDWGIISDNVQFGEHGAARAWGVEHLSSEERLLMALDAGVDQFGGEHCTDLLLRLVRDGRLPEKRIDESARRLLREKFLLGLFDAPFVDEDAAAVTVGCDAFRAAGLQAQKDSLTLLSNRPSPTLGSGPALPLARGIKLYTEGVSSADLAPYAVAVADPEEADAALIRLKAPYERVAEPGIAQLFHHGSLEFPEAELERIEGICSSVPTVIDVYLDRPAVVTRLAESAAALVANFGVQGPALLEVLFGASSPRGRLPFDLPRSDAAVTESASDLPFDTKEPVFRFGFGLSYETGTRAERP
ncbi:beta-glucosidase [Streptomyces sp. alain-838]|nr:glycoside hydrolase family 3 N-terminal domain-containing protein [Streptomyces sp. alain-838]PAK25670.1 beta-glucosidase [Streptomyces sp. alain-838]